MLALSDIAIVRPIWMIIDAVLKRPRLKVEVYWNNSDEDGAFPYITVRNVGGQTVYLDTIALVEDNGAKNFVGGFDNKELKTGQKFSHRATWEDDPSDSPEFFHGWEGLRVCVTDALGKDWFSAPTPTKPDWFYLSKPIPGLDWNVPAPTSS